MKISAYHSVPLQPKVNARRVSFDKYDHVHSFYRSDSIVTQYNPKLIPRKPILKPDPQERIQRDLLTLPRTIPKPRPIQTSTAQKVARTLGVMSVASVFMVAALGPAALAITGILAVGSFIAWGCHEPPEVPKKRFWDNEADKALRANLIRRDPILDLRGYVFTELPQSLKAYRHLKYIIVDDGSVGPKGNSFGHIQLLNSGK